MAWRDRVIRLLRGIVDGVEKASNAGLRGARRGVDSLEKRRATNPAAAPPPEGGGDPPPVSL